MRNNLKITAAVLMLASSLCATNSLAATQDSTAGATFLTPITFGSVTAASFGYIKALATGTYVLATDGTMAAPGGTGEREGGTLAAGSMSIIGSTTQTINIGVAAGAANNGATLSAFRCNYDAGGEVGCGDASLDTAAAPGAGKTLLVGMTLTAASTANNTVAAAPYTVTVVYN